MKVVIDECLPKRLGQIVPGDSVSTVPQLGLAGVKDAELLDSLDARHVDVFVTIDGNLEYQQRLTNRAFGTVLIRTVKAIEKPKKPLWWRA